MPGMPAHGVKTSADTAGSESGGGCGRASVVSVGPGVDGVDVRGAGPGLQPLTATSVIPRASPVHTLGRTGPTLSCRPMFTTPAPVAEVAA